MGKTRAYNWRFSTAKTKECYGRSNATMSEITTYSKTNNFVKKKREKVFTPKFLLLCFCQTQPNVSEHETVVAVDCQMAACTEPSAAGHFFLLKERVSAPLSLSACSVWGAAVKLVTQQKRFSSVATYGRVSVTIAVRKVVPPWQHYNYITLDKNLMCAFYVFTLVIFVWIFFFFFLKNWNLYVWQHQMCKNLQRGNAFLKHCMHFIWYIWKSWELQCDKVRKV